MPREIVACFPWGDLQCVNSPDLQSHKVLGYTDPSPLSIGMEPGSTHCHRNHPGVIPLQPHGSRRPLFWVDGGPLFLLAANRLGLEQPVFGLRVPASEATRFRVPGKIDESAGELVRYLREVQPAGPYNLAGLCIAGLIAYEMARQLMRDGQEVALLAIFDVPGPNDHEESPNASNGAKRKPKTQVLLQELWEGGFTGVPGFAYRRSTAVARRLKLLRWRIQQGLGFEINRNRLLNDPDGIEEPTSYFSAPRRYSGRVTFFQSGDWTGPNGAWCDLIGSCEVHRVSGGHLSMFDGEHVDSVVSILQECLVRSEMKVA